MSEKVKKCVCCNIIKPADKFNYHPNTSDRMNSYCSGCIRDSALAKKFGVSVHDVVEFRSKHSGRCDCCGREETARVSQNRSEARALALDHDHRTNRIRGLICMNCNTALGKVGDDVERLKKLINYLKRNPPRR